MARDPEGLCYVLKSRTGVADPQGIVEEVVDFCLRGLPDGEGFQVNEDGEITGVVNWLVADGVTSANFYTITSPAPMLFVSLPHNGSDPWTSIPAFKEFIDGEKEISLGVAGIKLAARGDIDAALTDRSRALRRRPPTERAQLATALRGKGNLREALREADERGPDRASSFF